MEIPKKSLYFGKRNFYILQETELSYTSQTELSYILGKVYLEPEAYLELEACSEPWHI